jgi:hypothetical protein
MLYSYCCPPEDEHIVTRHIEDSNKYIIQEIVCQGGYLPELYEDALSEKY